MSVRTKIVTSDEEKHMVFRLRYSYFTNELGLMPQREDHRIADAFDTFEKTANIACFSGNRVVGGLRFTESSPFGLPAAALYDYQPNIPMAGSRTVGCDMLCMRKDFRGSSKVVIAMFLMGCYWSSLRGATHVLAPVQPQMAKKIARMGFAPVASEQTVPNSDITFIPMLLDLQNVQDMFLDFVEQQKINTYVDQFEREFFSKREYLIQAGEEGACSYVIVSGKVAVTIGRADRPGEQKVLNELGPGDLLGELALLSSSKRAANAIALTDVDTVVIQRDVFRREVVGDPDRALKLLELLGSRLQDALGLLSLDGLPPKSGSPKTKHKTPAA